MSDFYCAQIVPKPCQKVAHSGNTRKMYSLYVIDFIEYAQKHWRVGGDSNPRYVTVYTLSKRAPSATRPPTLLFRTLLQPVPNKPLSHRPQHQELTAAIAFIQQAVLNLACYFSILST